MPFFGSLGTFVIRAVLVVAVILNAVTTLAGTGVAGQGNSFATFGNSKGLAIDSGGNLYVADNNSLRKVTPTGVVTTLAGNRLSVGLTNGTGTNAVFYYIEGVAIDSTDTLYVADWANCAVRKITSTGVVTTLAGNGTPAFADGTGTNARFSSPVGIAVDSSGTVYLADTSNNRIRKITSTGVVTTIAGQTTAGSTNATGTNATFNNPRGVALDSTGTLYIADTNNNLIRKIDTSGVVTTLAGSGSSTPFSDGTGAGATFNSPRGIVVDSGGNVYVGDTGNNRIRRITPSGVVTTLAGSGTGSFADGTGTNARFNSLLGGLVFDSSGNLYVADSGNNRIRRITSSGVVTTYAGNGNNVFSNGIPQFNTPYGVATDWDGNVYVADNTNHLICKITPTGIVSNLAGNGNAGFLDGTGEGASFNYPYAVAVDSTQNVYVSDSINYRIRKITSAGVVTTLAGSGTAATTNGTGGGASFNLPRGITVDLSGNVFVSEQNGHVIRKITSGGVVTTLAGTAGTLGSTDATGTAASFNRPFGVVADLFGNVYVSDTYNHRIRRITSDRIVTTLAGSTVGFADGTGTSARFNFPETMSIDPLGFLYVADETGQRIRKINPSTGVVTTLAGTGTAGFANGTALEATFRDPHGIAVDRFRQAYVGDRNNHAIRKIADVYTLPENNGVVTTVAGTDSETGGFVDGSGIGARFNEPCGIGIDSVGNLYIGDQTNMRVRKITPAGVVTTFAGNGTQSSIDGTGTNATIDSPIGIVVDSTGNLYVLQYGHRIRKITPGGVVTTLAGSSQGFNNGTGTNAQFNFPFDLAVDLAGFVYVADTNNHLIRKITPAGVVTTFAGSTAGSTNGIGTNASFNYPTGIEIDLNNNLYVADRSNHRIRKITSEGVVTTFAGSSLGFNNGTGTNANFNSPVGIALDSAGTVYVADQNNYRIRKITPTGVVTTLAGNSTRFNINGTGTNASFGLPVGITVDPSGIVYVSDQTYHTIRKIGSGTVQLPLNRGVTTTIAGNGTTTFANGTGTNATFNNPIGLSLDLDGNIYVGDQVNHRIRKITPVGVVTTLAGSGTGTFADGTGASASFNNPCITAVDSSGHVYVADQSNHRIRKITPAGVVSTLAGQTSTGSANGTGAAASFFFPFGVAVDSLGHVYVADTFNNLIRKITPAGVVTTLAGSTSGSWVDGVGINARFSGPFGISVDSAGNVYVGDGVNQRIRKITPDGVVTTLAGNGGTTFADGTGTNATFNNPRAVSVDSAGNVYVGDITNHRIRRITPSGVVTTLAGNGGTTFADGTGTNATFNEPYGVAVDLGGSVYVADMNNKRIRKIS
jgi:streptogramin lyase